MKSWLMIRFIAPFALSSVTPSRASDVARPHPVLELRQYKIVDGKRDSFITLFEREFIDTQEALGMRLVGQFRDQDDPSRFVWLREFPDMSSRGKQLPDFYYGPVWKAHRDEANPYLDDNDNVLLLRPVAKADDFPASSGRASFGSTPSPHGIVVANILYLWKDPTTGFAAFFDADVRPILEHAGLPVLGVFVQEAEANNFTRLPVRQGEKVLVWFTRVADNRAYSRAWRKATGSSDWKSATGAAFADAQERAPQRLYLNPTPRSALR